MDRLTVKLVDQLDRWIVVGHKNRLRDIIRSLQSCLGTDRGIDAFLVPQWGGVIFYNSPILSNNDIIEVKMETILPTIIRQLKLLLGLPEHDVS